MSRWLQRSSWARAHISYAISSNGCMARVLGPAYSAGALLSTALVDRHVLHPLMAEALESHGSGLLLIVSGPAGSGETTVCDRMLAEEAGATGGHLDDAPTSGGRNSPGRLPFLRPEPTFDAKVAAATSTNGPTCTRTATAHLKSEIHEKLDAGTDLLLNIDVQGAATFRDAGHQDSRLKGRVVTVFIMPPSTDELEHRLRSRSTDDEDEIQRRMRVARDEMEQREHYDHCIHSGTRDEDFQALREIYLREKAGIRGKA